MLNQTLQVAKAFQPRLMVVSSFSDKDFLLQSTQKHLTWDFPFQVNCWRSNKLRFIISSIRLQIRAEKFFQVKLFFFFFQSHLTSGVHRGSILGFLVFNVYMLFLEFIFGYADDTHICLSDRHNPLKQLQSKLHYNLGENLDPSENKSKVFWFEKLVLFVSSVFIL